MIPIRLYAAIAVSGLLLAVLVTWLRRARKTPEQREGLRRKVLDAGGRIADGTVTDVQEMRTDDGRAAQLLIYQYDVSGVTYHCSQDVTRLRHHIDLHSCRLGLRASVKYDPQNPGNSIVVSERWTGLHG
ncbi:MAG TPA: DUF3592 domain-containing protein [Terriglobales bacterium]|jgi:hypothetical protein|nr:DUF3592 domain-containing protein [Terriglobales bacterium]